MKQEVGETRDAIIEDDLKTVEAIVNANKNRKDPYWIVIYAKPSKQFFEGKPVLVKHIKPYPRKPMSQVGMIVVEVQPSTGKLLWEVNMPQRPFDFDALAAQYGGKSCNEAVIETSTIPGAYITQ